MKNWMGTREAAEYLKLHYVTLYKLAQQGRIPSSKIGGVWRFNKETLDRWLAKQAIGAVGNVLIVDDDPSILDLLSDIISMEEFKVVAVESGEKAIEELNKQRFDLIFLDLLLPDMSGVDVLSAIRQLDSGSAVAIITGYADDPMVDEVISMSPQFLIRKPFRVSEIIEIIKASGLYEAKGVGDVERQRVLSHFLEPKQQWRQIEAGKTVTRRPLETDEPKFRELLDLLPEMIFEADLQGMITYANRVAFEAFGYVQDDVERGVNILQLVIPEDREKAKNNMLRILSGEDIGVNEYIVRRKDGTKFPVILHSNLVTDDRGNAVGFRGMVIRLGTADQLEEMLWESEEERRIVFDSIGDAIVVTDMAGHITKANDAAAHMVGLSGKAQLIGKNAFTFITAKDRPFALDTLKDGRTDGIVSERIEYEVLTVDGKEFDADVSVSLLRDGSGNPIGFIGVARDVTERKRAEEILRQSEEDYRTLFESTIDGMVVIDYESMKVVLANKTAITMYGFDPTDEIDKIDLLDHVHPDDREGAMASLAEDMFVKDLRKIVEFRTFTKDGKIKWVSGLGTKFRYHGRKAGLVSFRDITEQKRVEEALRESEERYRHLIENTGEMVQSVAPDGRFIFVNRAWHDTLGYSDKDLKRLTLLDIIHSDSLDHCREHFNRVINGETVTQFEAKFKARDGSIIYVEGDASPRYIGDQIVGTHGFFRDITKNRRNRGRVHHRRR